MPASPRPSTSCRRNGFTLLELVLVMAVIAILALMALPNLRDKYVREQIVEAMQLTSVAKGPLSIAWAATKSFPADNAQAGLPAPDKVVSNYVSAVTVEGGAIHVMFGNQVNGAIRGKTLSLRPAVVEDAPVVPVSWVCGHAATPDKMKVMGANRTDIPKTLLPFNCR